MRAGRIDGAAVRSQGAGGKPFAISAAALIVAAMCSSAHAMGIESGHEDVSIRWDNTLRYNAGWRVEGINDDFANSATYDETETTFDKGDMVLNRIDVISEFDLVYKARHGFRVSASAWYDQAYDDKRPRVSPALEGTGSYVDDEYSAYTKRYHEGLSGELLDAFLFTGFDVGSTSVSVKAGQHTVFWGDSLFTTFHNIAYSQAPLDGLKAASSPGITAKEVFRPVNQISMLVQPTPELVIAAQYFLEWEPNRLPQGGTYFGATDVLWEGAERLFLGYNEGTPLFAYQTNAVEPTHGAGNNYGVALRWSPFWLNGTAGLYFRQFDEVQAWGPVLGIDSSSFAPTDYHLAYAEDTRLVGLSLNKDVGGVSLGSELSYRHDTALASASSFAAAGDFEGVEGARGDSLHFLVNGIYLMPKTPLWVGGTLQGELVYSHLLDVTKNEDLYKGEGYAGCPEGQDKSDGCTTDDVVLAQVGFRPEWSQVLPFGGNLAAPTSFAYGIYGNGATLGGGNEGVYNWSVGLEATFRARYVVSLKYNDQHADYTAVNGVVSTASGGAVQNNHGWVSLAFQTTF
ncbi:MAG: DUF1302 family protein [Pseudomonadota bacterium]|nr:DUF1302 family protein [Pseudomonadota bacterium]